MIQKERRGRDTVTMRESEEENIKTKSERESVCVFEREGGGRYSYEEREIERE